MIQKLQSASARHFDVQYHDGNTVTCKIFQCLSHIIGTEYFVKKRPFLRYLFLGAFRAVIFIIHNQ